MKQKHKKWAIGICAVLLGYSILGFLVAPWYLKTALVDYVKENTAATLSVESIQINPFTFHVQVKAISLQQADAAEMIAADELFLDLDVTGLISKKLVVSSVRLVKPKVDAVIDASGELNLVQAFKSEEEASQEVSEEVSEEASEPSSFNFVLGAAELVAGQFSMTDNAHETPRLAAVEDINLALTNISSIKDSTGTYIFSLRSGSESTLKTSGDVSLNPLLVNGKLALNKISLEQILEWVGDQTPIVTANGALNISGNYAFSSSNDEVGFALNNVAASINDVSITDAYTSLSTSVKSFAIEGASFTSPDSTLNIAKTSLSDFAAKTATDTDYLLFSDLTFNDIALNLNDGKLSVSDVNLEGVSSIPDPASKPLVQMDVFYLQAIDYAMADGVLNIGNIGLSKTASLLPVDNKRLLRLPSLPMKAATAAPIANENNPDDDSEGGFTRLTIGNIDLKDVDIKTLADEGDAGEEKLLALSAFGLRELDLDLTQSTLGIANIAIDDTDIDLSIDKDRNLNIVRWFLAAATEETTPADDADKDPLNYTIDKIEINGTSIGLLNLGLASPVQHRTSNIALTIEDLSSVNEQHANVDLSANIGASGQGELAVKGWVAPSVFSAQLGLKVSGLDLTLFNPYVADATTLKLASGVLSLSAQTEVLPNLAVTRVRDGQIDLTNLQLNEIASDEKLLAAEKLAMSDVSYDSDTAQLSINEVVNTKPYINVFINEKSELNLAQVVRQNDSEAASSKAVADTKTEAEPMKIAIKSIQLQDGSMDFSDQSLRPRFSTKIHGLNGAATGVNSDLARYATLALEGNINEYGSATITGELQPFAFDQETEIMMQFRNLDISSVTPYSAKFAGRNIDAGSLSLNLDYKVSKGKVDGNNNIIVKSLVLGERTDSPDAMDLPLDMAISLLEDSEGKIDLDLPISGDLDSPDFDIGGVIQKAIGNLITGIVTSPFQFLGSLLGGDTAELDIIEFKPGSDKIMPSEAEKLNNLATALASRPALALTVTGRYAKEMDTNALARIKLKAEMSAISALPAGPINTSDPEVQDVLDDLADDRLSKETLKKLDADRKQQESTEEKQVAEKDYYSALFEQLIAFNAASFPKSELSLLANRRAESIVSYITESTPAVASRINIDGKVIVKPSESETVSLVLELGSVK